MDDVLEEIARCASYSQENVATPLTQPALCWNKVTLTLFEGEEMIIRMVQKETFIIWGFCEVVDIHQGRLVFYIGVRGNIFVYQEKVTAFLFMLVSKEIFNALIKASSS